ncbi:DUF58 domain-containing protein [Echinicola sp. CAU 1574]|uniref:DUF58 domain-containing protein n=1 Tax=Echinicola arenosa TaxID=2774144 RepID=A0ABR9AGB1_9BACT|nr:DUF58 domain-containing protein [Echinicola arenosa]MBD8487322.1 DUF58 domain-containing protein [Echinicola arenosa]
MGNGKEIFPKDIFISLKELLGMEHLALHFSLLARKQKVNSILGGKHASKLRGRGLDFEEVRNYVNGDDIRNIDWKVTARTHQTHTRVFTEEKEKPALIVVDQSKSMFFGSQKYTKSVVAARLAAMVAFMVLKEGDRVGGVVFADQGIDIVFPKRDRKNILRFFEKIVNRNHELADSSPVQFEEALKETFKKTRNIVTHDFMVVVISDFLRYSPQLTKFIAQIAQHNDVLLAKVTDPMEWEIPDIKFVAGDRESQAAIDGEKKNIRDSLQNRFKSDFEKFKSEMKKHRVPLFSINTIEPVDIQLKEIFKEGRR